MRITINKALTILETKALEAIAYDGLTPAETSRLKWNLLKLNKELVREKAEFEDYRVELIKTLGEADEEGNTRVTAENQKQFSDQLLAVLDEETEVHGIKLKLDQLHACTLAQMQALEDFVDETESA